MKLAVLGEDLVAWTLAAALASTGCKVSMTACDLPDPSSEEQEPDLHTLLQQQLAAGRLTLACGLEALGREGMDLLVDAREYQTTDLIFGTIEQLGFPPVVALVQAVSLGTTDALQQRLRQETDATTAVVYWPNFVQAGRALDSFTRVEQLIVGSDDDDAIDLVKQLMLPFNRSHDRFSVVTAAEAELTKIAINGMLATRISFMNELAALAGQKGIDIEAVRQCMGADSRIGYQYLYPGCGFAGEAFLHTLQQLNRELESVHADDAGLLASVQRINEQQQDLLFQKLWRFYKADLVGKRVAIWGAAYKPNTASITGSPALHLIRVLLDNGVQVQVYDPRALPSLRDAFADEANLQLSDSPLAAAEQADALMLLTEWKEFWNVDLLGVKATMRTPLLLDGRNIYDPDMLAENGWIYSGVGRGVNI